MNTPTIFDCYYYSIPKRLVAIDVSTYYLSYDPYFNFSKLYELIDSLRKDRDIRVVYDIYIRDFMFMDLYHFLIKDSDISNWNNNSIYSLARFAEGVFFVLNCYYSYDLKNPPNKSMEYFAQKEDYRILKEYICDKKNLSSEYEYLCYLGGQDKLEDLKRTLKVS